MSHGKEMNDHGNSCQNGIGIGEYKPKVFNNYQKPMDTAHTSTTWDLKHCYYNEISLTKDKNKVEFKANVSCLIILSIRYTSCET